MPDFVSSERQTLWLATDGPQSTQALASAIADSLVDGDLLVLSGDLGAGKTCFTQGLAAGLGIDVPVTSPTFTLANRYDGRLRLHHLDVYRVESEADAVDLAIEELLEDGVTVIEWGERVAGLLPEHRFDIALRYPDPTDDDPDPDLDRRIIELVGPVAARGLDLQEWAKR